MNVFLRKSLFLCILLILSSVIFILSCRSQIKREEWSEKWGPLVPHNTFPGDCGICHTTDNWNTIRKDFAFDHEKETGYALEGAHKNASCLRCHNDRGPVEEYVAHGCGGCHPDPHASALGLDCEQCHNQIDWRPTGLVTEHAATRFHLVGAHAVAPCESCHLQAAIGQFRGAPLQCEFCHQDDLTRANSPDHLANGWTSNCQRCHTPLGWGGGDFSHYFFPLTGAHAYLECIECHTSGTFEPIPSDCYSCHADDYELGPDHLYYGYPLTCEQCHSTYSWSPAYFTHSFPIAGVHDVECSECHTSGNTSSFNCLDCHEQGATNLIHDDEDGYQYNSQSCYSCHPNGIAEGDD